MFEDKKAVKVDNMEYKEQMSIQKKLVLEPGIESDVSELSDVEGAVPRKSIEVDVNKPDLNLPQRKIFKYITVQDKHVFLPDKVNKDSLTLFMELDDIILHTYIYDENFGFMSDPAAKDPEYKLKLGPKNMPIHLYLRDYMQEFMDFLKENRDKIETIIYTSGVPEYTNLIINAIDPKREVFQHVLYQGACYIF